MISERMRTHHHTRFSWRPRKSSSTAELIARVLHVLIGLFLFCGSVWAATYIESPYQVIYIVTMLLSLLMVGSGLYARRETVFKAFLGYWC
ncbi:hypothetical protein IM543_05095 [Massilia sp. UMI-21]|nr:hypothetical protein IM543_05095 [Massilia sp. UMI-21]